MIRHRGRGTVSKAPCHVCDKLLPRKRHRIILGLRIAGKQARVCPECDALSEDEHKVELEKTEAERDKDE